MFIACATRSARGCAAAGPGTRCSRSARPLRPRRGRSALPQARQVVGITHGCESARAQAEDRRDHPRDHVAGLLDHDRVPLAEVLAREVLGVVQRRHRDGRAGDEHRLEHGVGRVRAGASDVDLDLQQLRVRLLRGELERRRPARELRRRAQPLAQRQVVDLDDDAVGVERRDRGARPPTSGRTRPPRRCRRSARQWDSTGSRQRAHRLERLA